MRVVIPSVNYGDLLSVTLPAWCHVVGHPNAITVVTTPEDEETIRVAERSGVRVHVTDAWTRHDQSWPIPDHWNGLWRERGRKDRTPVMNKALAMDEAFGFVPGFREAPSRGEPCLALDADCYPDGALPHHATIETNVLYGCRRFEGFPDLTRGREIVLKGRITKSQHRGAIAVGGGYFQLFRFVPGRRFGSYPGADGYDYDFAFLWPRGVVLESISVLHFGETHMNWEGRKTPRWEGAQQ